MKLRVALLGAESTGKSTLAHALAASLRTDPATATASTCVVDEYLREFCDREGRTPVLGEQQHIADEQSRRIHLAAATHGIVIADTAAVMTAVYSEMVFGDTSLYECAQADLAHFDLVLLTALDLPWQPDGLQRDGPHVREPVQRLLRAALTRAAVPYAVISGQGAARLACALGAVRHALGHAIGKGEPTDEPPPEHTKTSAEAHTNPPWKWFCERCSDGDCERHARAWLARG